MRKSLVTLCMMSIMALSLTSCGEGYNYKDGVMLTVNGKEYTTDELFNQFGLNTSAGVSAYYQAVNNILIEANIAKTGTMDRAVEGNIENFQQAAENAAKSNGTTTAEELEKSLESEGVDNLDELRNKYYLQQKTEKANNDFYSDTRYNEDWIPEYIEQLHPYHVRHILVNVDANTKYNGQISDTNAKDIANVITRLASENEDFGTIAQAKSGDTSSATWFGELQQPMSTKTSYVNEFKLNLYTYEAYFNKLTADNSNIDNDLLAPSDLKVYDGTSNTTVKDAYEDLYDDGVYGIPYSAALAMDYYSEVTTDNNGLDVVSNNDNSVDYYPRNIFFNNFFNNHALSFIYLDEFSDTANNDANKAEYYSEEIYNQVNQSTRWQPISEKLNANLKVITEDTSNTKHTSTTSQVASSSNKKILCDENGNPILVARAGTGSGDSGYQGIHFITIIKDPYLSTQEELNDYYNIDKPDTSDANWEPGQTFIGYSYSSNSNDYTTKINNFKDGSGEGGDSSSSVKGQLDANFDFRLYEENLALAEAGNGANNITVKLNDDVKTAINNYIETTRANTLLSETKTWNDNWTTFYEYLAEYEIGYKNNVLPLSAIQAFQNGSSAVNSYESQRAGASN